MSERKVLTKYYPPDFDPSKITRTRKSKDASSSTKNLATVRLMAPFSMKCLACGEFIYKGRKFNARKEITDEKYLSITIYRFYIRCTRCSAEITFKTDPKGMDYTAERGAKRNFEMWRQGPETDAEGKELGLETEEEMLDRLEREAAEQNTGGAMADLEAKVHDAKTEMTIADALDEIRMKNARISRAEGREGQDEAVRIADAKRISEEAEKERVDRMDRERAERAFAEARKAQERRLGLDIETVEDEDGIPLTSLPGRWKEETGDEEEERRSMPPPPLPQTSSTSTSASAPTSTTSTPTSSLTPFAKRTTKKRKPDFGAALGIKKKKALV